MSTSLLGEGLIVEKLLLASTLDGNLHGIDSSSGFIRWTVNNGMRDISCNYCGQYISM